MAILRKSPKRDLSKSIFDSILLAAARILPVQGFARSTTNKIAEAAGVSIGSLYQYFPNKESLVAALIERHVDRHVKIVESRLAERGEPSVDEVTDFLIRPILDNVREHRQLFKVIGAQVFSVGGLEPIVAGRQKLVAIIEALLEKNRARLPEGLRPRHASYLIVNSVAGVVEALVFDDCDDAFRAEMVEETISSVKKYLKHQQRE
jgi:AcrR family transcriptional regulator